jgi:hypothetical protein
MEQAIRTTMKPMQARHKTARINYYMIAQKLTGVILIALGFVSAKISGDGTAMLMLIMLGLPVVFSKEKVLMI